MRSFSFARFLLAFALVCQTQLFAATGDALSTVDALTADKLLDPNHVVEVVVTMPPAQWQALCNQSRDFRQAFTNPTNKPYTYFKADVEIDGVQISQVGLRKKGFIGSQDTFRPSLKIKFDEYVDQKPVAGVLQLTLNNNKQDRSLLSQSLTYHVFRNAGVHAPRCTFATVTVNGQYLGIYSHVESVKPSYLQNEFGDGSGKLYEGTLSDFYPKAIDRVEAKDDAADKDRSKIRRLAEVLDADRVSLAEIEKLVDIDNFLKFWAIESLIGFWDGYTQNQNNFFVYENPKDGKLYFMPWGADSCFTNGRGSGRGPQYASVRAESILANRLYHLDGMSDRYKQTMSALLRDVWNAESLNLEIDRMTEMIFDDVSELQLDSFAATKDVREFIDNRAAAVRAEIDEEWPIELSDQPRLPMYVIPVGSASGSFSLKWNAEPTAGALDSVKVTMDGKPVELTSVKSQAKLEEPSPWSQFRGGGAADDPAVALTINCETKSGEPLNFTFRVAQKMFAANKMPAEGMLTNNGGRRGFGGGKTFKGELELSNAGMKPGDDVSGSFSVDITEMRGGFMSRGR